MSIWSYIFFTLYIFVLQINGYLYFIMYQFSRGFINYALQRLSIVRHKAHQYLYVKLNLSLLYLFILFVCFPQYE